MNNLNKIKTGAGGEVQLTDAIAEEIATSDNVVRVPVPRVSGSIAAQKAGFLAGDGRLRPGTR